MLATSRTVGKNGFTLVELLATITIIAVLVGLGTVGYMKAIDSADSVRCLANMRAVGVGISMYCADHQGFLPGQCDNSIRHTYRINNNDLGAFLAPYWNLPPADTITRDAPALMCPAWKRKVNVAGGKCYLNPSGIKGYYNADGTRKYCPFKGNSDSPMRMLAILSIPGLMASQQWMVQDFDQVNCVTINITGQAATPVHGSVRNVLFFDLHAEAVPATTILN